MDTHLDLSLYDVEKISLSSFRLESGSWVVSLVITEHDKYPHRIVLFCDPQPQMHPSLIQTEGPIGTTLLQQHWCQAVRVHEVNHMVAGGKPFVTVKLEILSQHGDWGITLYTYKNSDLGLTAGQVVLSTTEECVPEEVYE